MSAAIAHVLQQLQRDGRLAYLIGPGSQSYELLTQEAAAAAGRDVNEYRRELEARLAPPERWPSENDIRDRIEQALDAAAGRES